MTRRTLSLAATVALLLAALTAAADNPTTRPTTRPAPTTRPTETSKQLKGRMRELWREAIAAPDSGEPQSDELRKAVADLQKVRLLPFVRPELPEKDPQPTRRPAPKTQPTSQPDPGVPIRSISPETLKKFRNVDLNGVADPIRLADSLYRGGHLDAAAFFYTRALKQADAETDVAWVYFQLGNSLRRSDPEKAAEMYRDLIAKYPKSPWAKPAGVQEQLLAWRRTNRPDKLIDQTDTDTTE